MGMSVVTDKSRSVYRKDHMAVHEAAVCDHLIIGSLQERRIDRDNRNES